MRRGKKEKVEKAIRKMQGAPEFVAMSFHENLAKSRLVIGRGMVSVDSCQEIPNRWHRFWYKTLLGWKWEKVEAKNEKI